MGETQSATGSVSAEKQYHSKLLDFFKAWLSVLTVVGGALWGLYLYIANEGKAETTRRDQAEAFEKQRDAQARRDNMTRRIEARKPFLELQLKTYLKTATIVGKIINVSPKNALFYELWNEFESLYWTELALVEDSGVANAMVEVRKVLQRYQSDPDHVQEELKLAALHLGHAIGDSIRSGWQGIGP
jgi:hypothetical protein